MTLLLPDTDIKAFADATHATTEDSEYPFNQPHRTSEQVLLWQALQDPPQTKACGWLELDNGFMFFTDRTMFERTTTTFSIPVLVDA